MYVNEVNIMRPISTIGFPDIYKQSIIDYNLQNVSKLTNSKSELMHNTIWFTTLKSIYQYNMKKSYV